MSRKLLYLNLALVVLLCATGWRIWKIRQERKAREEAVLQHAPEVPASPAEASIKPPEPVVAADYIEVASQLLFAPDRNPEVVIEAEAAKPLPPLPVAHGVLDLGSGPTVILSKGPKDAQRGYRVGDLFGDYRVVDITADSITLDFEGELVRRSLEELKPHTDETVAPRQAPPAKAKAASSGTKVLSISSGTKTGPSKIDMGGGIRACQRGDKSPPGTIVDGYKKVVTRTPFGETCRWEPVP